jgi:ERCC4-type nuclease
MDSIRVEVDNREDPVFQSILRNFAREDSATFAIEFDVQQLSVGDVMIWGKNPVMVERKTFPDLLMSIKDGRFRKQLTNMKEQDKFDRFLVVEGIFVEDENGIKHFDTNKGRWGRPSFFKSSAVSRAMESIRRYDVTMMYSPDVLWTANWISAKWRSMQKKKSKVSPYHVRSTYSDKTISENILYGLSGLVGSERAMTLLDKFGTVKDAIQASDEELSEVKLWGPKTIKKWNEVMKTKFDRKDIR